MHIFYLDEDGISMQMEYIKISAKNGIKSKVYKWTFQNLNIKFHLRRNFEQTKHRASIVQDINKIWHIQTNICMGISQP